MADYKKVLAAFGDSKPITVSVSWGQVVVHQLTVDQYIDSVADKEQKPIYSMIASAVTVDGDYWTAAQWAGLPKKAMEDITKIYEAYEQLNGSEGGDEKK